MKNLPQIKVYEIDYEFIIKNYTSPKLWDKIWNLFIYKNYIFTLNLSSINVKKKQIHFEIKLNSDLDIWNRNVDITFMYDVQNMSIEDLKRLVNSNMFSLIQRLETEYIERKDSTYQYIENSRDDEQQRLREIAEDFLNDNNVSNSDIREVYIDYYVDENETIWRQLQNYKEKVRYTYLTDLYLIFAELTSDNELKNKIIENQTNDISEIESEVEEFMKYLETDEFTEEMQDKLEAI